MASFARIADEDVRNLIQRGVSYGQIAIYYQSLHPNATGMSSRGIRRYCNEGNISRITNEALQDLVRDMIILYGHNYGRKMMQGNIRVLIGHSYLVSQRHISRALMAVAPMKHEARARDLLIRTNPVPYFALYFEFKAHLDQNKKIGQDYGCTHVLMMDGCSRLIVGYTVIPIKNPVLVYEYMFRPAVLKYGVSEQVRMDHGRELALVIFIQQVLSCYCLEGRKQPFKQTRSTVKQCC